MHVHLVTAGTHGVRDPPTASLLPDSGLDTASRASHYPTIDLTHDSFSHLEVCEFNRALKRSRLHGIDSEEVGVSEFAIPVALF